MEFRRIISPFALILLFIAFAVITAIVFLQKGRNTKWISRKMKLGAAILTITGITTGCPPQVTCYDPVPSNFFQFDQINYDENAIIVDLPKDTVITGRIITPDFDAYSFEISTTDSVVVQTGYVIPEDGKLDSDDEKIKIIVDSKLIEGDYYLNISSAEDDFENYVVCRNNLKIK
ncbi:MAG: hypothetical protein KA807_10105 [Prolixibacteraceae bacterium]|nr:hypothetical protein [Prolixibacteraceae bacterium]